ncbi:MAG: cobalamin-binding protein [Frankiales bacterium]|nr:cobalamin-binding protein [Frankiales bacterium]
MRKHRVNADSERFWACLLAADASAGRRIVSGQLDDGVPGSTIIRDLLVPAQHAVGLAWQSASWSVADEHAATAVVDSALAAVESSNAVRRVTGRVYVMACAESEWHSMPARLAAQLVRESGAQVRFLGASLPADPLREYLAQVRPAALLLSATMPTSLPGAARCIDAAHDVGVKVIVGGGAFGADESRARTLQADAWMLDPGELSGVRFWDRPSRAPRWEACLALQADAEAVVAAAYGRLLVDLPQPREMWPIQQLLTRDDFGRIVDFTATSLLLDDSRVLSAFVSWLADVLEARHVPRGVLIPSLLALAAAMDDVAKSAGSKPPLLLRRVAARAVA